MVSVVSMHVRKGIGQVSTTMALKTIREALEALGELPYGPFVRTVTLPEGEGHDLVDVLYGPMSGDEPVAESMVHYAVRGERPGASRMFNLPARPTRLLTLIGRKNVEDVLIYFGFGGRRPEREPFDPRIKTEEERQKSRDFWAVHAFASVGWYPPSQPWELGLIPQYHLPMEKTWRRRKLYR